MIETDKHHNAPHIRLLEAAALGTVNDVAHALIYYEVRDPTIGESVERAVERLITSVSGITGNDIKPENRVKLMKAIEIRRARLGDALWFSRY